MIYSIGHGNKEIEDLIRELKSFKILYLIDIRSNPYSKYCPHFNQSALENSLQDEGLTYVFMGDTLGGLPKDRSCYVEGKVVYDLIKEKGFFKKGLQRLVIADSKNIDVAIMCSETKPEECHRSKLIGQELLKESISLQHIINVDEIKDQTTVINELTKGNSGPDLFGNQPSFQSRNTYE